MNQDPVVKRVPVDFRYDAVNPTFLYWLARIGSYADAKYGAWQQYTGARLVGDKSPINHIFDHLRKYQMAEPYDHFDGDVRWHLVAVAYNAMMSFHYHSKWGPEKHPLAPEKGWWDDGSEAVHEILKEKFPRTLGLFEEKHDG